MTRNETAKETARATRSEIETGKKIKRETRNERGTVQCDQGLNQEKDCATATEGIGTAKDPEIAIGKEIEATGTQAEASDIVKDPVLEIETDFAIDLVIEEIGIGPAREAEAEIDTDIEIDPVIGAGTDTDTDLAVEIDGTETEAENECENEKGRETVNPKRIEIGTEKEKGTARESVNETESWSGQKESGIEKRNVNVKESEKNESARKI